MSNKSWVIDKLKDPKFKQGFEEEYHKLKVAEQLVRLRLQVGLTQAELAKKVKTTASAISRYENAEYEKYELQTIRKIVNACGGTLEIIISGPADEKKAG